MQETVSESSYYRCVICPFKSLRLDERQKHVQSHTLKEIAESPWWDYYPLLTGLNVAIEVRSY